MSTKIFVTKAFIPPIEEYNIHLNEIFENGQLTNLGIKHQELESKLMTYFETDKLLCVSNGTIALQLIFKLFEKGEIITTPFSYVATTNSILWEGFTPRFADIDALNCCLDPKKAEKLINEKTRAIVLTHVYGIPCDVEEFEKIGKKYNLPIIYDAAHAFGVNYKGKSLLTYGDFSTLSFHATKLFHTVEGGAIFTKSKDDYKKISLYRSFGHIADDYFDIGINGKMSELHAAMGLTVLPHIDALILKRKEASKNYDRLLNWNRLTKPQINSNTEYNYAYYPVLFGTNKIRERVFNELVTNDIFPRRYFSPSLNKLPFFTGESCPIAEDYAGRVLCLPLFHDLSEESIIRISDLINKILP